MNKIVLVAAALTLPLGGCATSVVTGAVVGTATTVTKVAAKTTIGAGKLAYRGTKAAVNGTRRLIADDPSEQIAFDRDALPDP